MVGIIASLTSLRSKEQASFKAVQDVYQSKVDHHRSLRVRFPFPVLILEVTLNVFGDLFVNLSVCLFEHLMLSLKMIPQSKKSVV